MTDSKENSSGQGESISPQVRARLLKKWKSILTRYSKLRDNEWVRTRVRGMITVRVDCSNNIGYYLDKINDAINIIQRLENQSEK